jgi:hypothetical protein
MKRHYDRKHQSLHMKIEDHVLLRLHKDYHISSTKVLEKKLEQQYADSFKITEKVENFAYRVNLSTH